MIKDKLPVLITAVLILSIGWLLFLHTQQPSNEKFIQAITSEFPVFLDDNKPVISIDSVSRHDNRWYVVNIKSLHDTETSVPVKLLLVESKRNLSIAIGPDTNFTEEKLLEYNLPESVILELQK